MGEGGGNVITTVTLNAAIDKTYYLDYYKSNAVNRVDKVLYEPGGKGINVAKVLQKLGTPVVTTGIVAGFNGKQICSLLDHMGIQHHFLQAEGESRLCLNIISEEDRGQTEILEPGPTINDRDWHATKERIAELASQSDYIIFSGSLPKGLSKSVYYELIMMAKEHGAKPILDTSGPALAEALSAKPYMIKPNHHEFEVLLGREKMSVEEIIDALRECRKYEIPIFMVTLGAEGSLALINEEVFKIEAPNIEAINPVGSGDAFTAGFAAGLHKGLSIEEMLQLAAASGAANALEERAGIISMDNVNVLKDKVVVKRMRRMGDSPPAL